MKIYLILLLSLVSANVAFAADTSTKAKVNTGSTFESIQPVPQSNASAKKYDEAVKYLKGHGVKQDLRKAKQLLQEAASEASAPAQTLLGMIYKLSSDEASQKKSVKWFLEAANSGNIDALYQLGLAYYNGKGVDRNYRQALNYFKKAADLGSRNAQFDVAKMYQHGIGVSR